MALPVKNNWRTSLEQILKTSYHHHIIIFQFLSNPAFYFTDTPGWVAKSSKRKHLEINEVVFTGWITFKLANQE